MTQITEIDFLPVAVIGAGAWGTTLAWLIASQGHPVTLWARSSQQAERINRERENHQRLPGVVMPDCLNATSEISKAVASAKLVIVVVPSEFLRQVARAMAACINPQAIVISATKGLEIGTGKRMSQVLAEETGVGSSQIFALSGPNLSAEIAHEMPAVSVIAGSCEKTVSEIQRFLSTSLFRIYGNYDILGVEMSGALKNVLALAAGCSDGLGFGANAKAAILTRGLTEIARLGTSLGAQRSTFWGVAGIGDLLATCNSALSRNWQVGYRIGEGHPVATALAQVDGVAEGVPTTAAALKLARSQGVDVPITAALNDVLFEGQEPRNAVEMLMTRQWRAELEPWQ